ncbi:MAG TPA: serine/threonine-protein kinase [Polyangiaceae bacterium]|nr:serine/threonine-protein kinase [Polyangiaceae bacterium]
MESVLPIPDEGRLEIGSAVTHYVVEGFLGQGAEGNVYLARDSVLGRLVALKTLRAGTVLETRGVEEARILSALEHPNIVRVYQARRYQGAWVVVFEYLSGGSVHALVRRVGALSPRQALEYTAQAGAGLAFAHEAGFLHRDVKPHNMLISRAGEVKLADFGLALDIRTERRSGGNPVGTPAFLAPEIWAGDLGSAASDVFSLGACLFFLLTGRLPFVATDAEQLRRAHLELEPKLPSGLPGPVRDLVLTMMAKAPEQRPASAALPEMLRSLARNPQRRITTESFLPVVNACDPFVDGGSERALSRVIREGREQADLSELLSALRSRPLGLELCAPEPADALLLLGVAREEVPDRFQPLARLTFSKAQSSLRSVIERKLGVKAALSLRQACEGILQQGPRDTALRPVLELYAPRALNDAQREEIAQLAGLASPLGVTCVLIRGRVSDDGIEGFRRVAAFESQEAERALDERLQRWLAIATGGRFSFTRDARLLISQVCREQSRWWARLAQDSLLISAAAGTRVVTTWAVMGACTQTTPWHSVEDVPAALRKKPFCWPTPELAARLAVLRAADARRSAPMTPTLEKGQLPHVFDHQR